MSADPIHISFIREVQGSDQKPNALNGLAVDIGSIDSNADDIAESEIKAASRDGRFRNIFKHISAEDLFRDLRSFAIARGIIYAKAHQMSTGDAIWLSENLFLGNHSGSHVGDLAGALHYANGTCPSEAIDDKTLLSGDSKLFDNFGAVAEKLETKDILLLLKKHKLFTTDAKKKGALLIINELAKRNTKSREAADALVEILEGDTETALRTLAGGIRDDYNTLKSMLDISYTWDQIKEGTESTADFLEKIGKDLPVGAKIAKRIRDVAILSAKNIDALVSIMQNKGHDVFTRASIAWAMGKAEYVDEAARKHAADKLASYLEEIEPCDWQNTKVSRIVFESVIALGQLGVERTGKRDICDVLLNYLADIRHPELQFAAAVAFGFLGSKMPPDSHGQKLVVNYLADALGDSDEAVRKAAEAALHMIEKPAK